jgi:hypothetical protein
MRVVVESGEHVFLDFLGGDRLFFPFSFVLLLFVGSFGKGEGGGRFPYFACRAATDTFLELGMACKPELLKEKKGNHSERWMISGQETVFCWVSVP